MDLFSVITLLGGLAFFLYGMEVMSGGLERMAGGKLEHSLRRMTSNPFKSLVLGAGITIAIQSSSALTVMLVGLVNSGIMNISQTVGVIMGSNVGTTLTAWLLSMVGLETSNIWLKLLKPENFSLVFALVGIIMIMMSKSSKKKDIGSILVGFAVLMYGMKLMSGAVAPLADQPEFASLLTAFENPILGVIIGAVFTGIIQSSAASVGILQALALTGSITFGMALPIIMGQNIGTCVTALISSIGVNRNAKKVSVIHISFNLIGTVIFMVLYYGLDAIFHFSFTDQPIDALGIAVVHSVFNVATTAMLLPFSKALVWIANTVMRDKQEATVAPTELIDERLLATPSIAISEANSLTRKMAKLTHETLNLALSTITEFSATASQQILDNEDTLDRYEDKLGTFLVKLSSKELSDADSIKISKMLHAIGDFERMGDHAVNLMRVFEELHTKKLSFSQQAQQEINVLQNAIYEILDMTSKAYHDTDLALASQVEPLEQVIDKLVAAIKSRHIARLQAGTCTIELGFILSDLLNNYARISDHCSNIAVSIIETSHASYDTHEYLQAVKSGDSDFESNFARFSAKYQV